jgi:hypothetical protein
LEVVFAEGVLLLLHGTRGVRAEERDLVAEAVERDDWGLEGHLGLLVE